MLLGNNVILYASDVSVGDSFGRGGGGGLVG